MKIWNKFMIVLTMAILMALCKCLPVNAVREEKENYNEDSCNLIKEEKEKLSIDESYNYEDYTKANNNKQEIQEELDINESDIANCSKEIVNNDEGVEVYSKINETEQLYSERNNTVVYDLDYDKEEYEIKDGKVIESLNKNEWIENSYYDENGNKVTGLYNIEGVTYYFDNNGEFQKEYTGMYTEKNGDMWYIEKGIVSNKTGSIYVKPRRYQIKNGKVDTEYTGLVDIRTKLVYIKNGLANYAYTGICEYEGTKWYVKNGVNAIKYNGVVTFEGEEYEIKDGKVIEPLNRNEWIENSYYDENGNKVTGLYNIEGVTYYFDNNGEFQKEYTGMYTEKNGDMWYIEKGIVSNKTGSIYVKPRRYQIKNGKVDTEYTGLVDIGTKLVYIKNGLANYAYTGICEYEGTKWYVKNGVNATLYIGLITFEGEEYEIKDGKVIECEYKSEWVENRYYDEDGNKVTGLYSIDGKKYYFDKNGIKQTGIIEIDGQEYYFDENGIMLIDEVFESDEKRYYADEKGYVSEIAKNEGYAFYYNQLSEPAKIIYDEILNNLEGFREGYNVIWFSSRLTNYAKKMKSHSWYKEAKKNVFDAFKYDHPEIFYIDFSKIRITCYGSNYDYKYYFEKTTGMDSIIYTENINSRDELDQKCEEVVQKEQDIINSIGATNDVEAVKGVHNWIVKNAECDDGSSSDNILRVLINGYSGSEGYARTFKIMMDLYNIPCFVVYGTAKRNLSDTASSQAWNYVLIDGEWYEIDIAGDDLKIEGIKDKYRFFLKGTMVSDFDEYHFRNDIMNEMRIKYPSLSEFNYFIEIEQDET